MLATSPRIVSAETLSSDFRYLALLGEASPTTSGQVTSYWGFPEQPSAGRANERLLIFDTANPLVACQGDVPVIIAYAPSGSSPSVDDLIADVGLFESPQETNDTSTNMKTNAMFAAYEIFGEMRTSTPEENELHRQMLQRAGKPFGKNLLDS